MLLARFLCGLLAGVTMYGPVFPAMAQDAAARFPDANQVAAEYPEPAAAYAALNLLWDALHAKSASPTAVRKRAAYYNLAQSIRQQRLLAGEKPAMDFDQRVRQLTTDANFRQSVLEKYHVANVPADAPSQNAGVTDAMIKRAAAEACPVALITVAVMILIVWAMVRSTSGASVAAPQPATAGIAPLPDSLRLVRLPGMEYALGVLSGRVIDKETTLKTSTQTTVTSGQVYSMGGEIHSTPGSVTTSSVTTQTDLIWIRTPEGGETSWTFTGGQFKARPGHLLSVIARGLHSGATAFLMAYNHTTKQLEVFGYGAAHATRRGLVAWAVSALIGAAGFAVAFGIFLSIQPPEQANGPHRLIYPASLYIEGLVVAAVLAAIITLKVKTSIWRKRNKKFEREYLPGLKRCLEERTGTVEKLLGSV